MSDKRKVKEIIKAIQKHKKRVAGSLEKTIEKKEHLFSILVPIFAGLLLFLFAILNLNSSIWFDESYSAYLVREDFSEIWDMTAQDVHPPFYYFALKMWSSIFGTSLTAMRFMSVFFGLIAIIFIFHLLKRWFGIKVASAGTVLAAISPMFIRYAQEMRMYTMVLAIVFAATYFLSLALDYAKEKKGRKYWVIYALLVCAGMWTHYFTAFVWIAHVVAILVHFGGLRKIFRDKKLFRTLCLVYIFSIVLYLPWISSFFNQIRLVQRGFWIPPVSFEVAADYISSALFFNTSGQVTSWVFLVGVVLIIFFVIGFRRVLAKTNAKTKSRIRFISIMAGVPVLVMTILSLPPLTSSFVDRYVLYSIVSLWILFGVILALMKDSLVRYIFGILLILTASFGIFFVENREPKGYIPEILAETFIAADEGEPIIANSVWTYYDAVFYTTEKHPIYIFEEWIRYDYGSLAPIQNYRVNVIKDSKEFLKNYESVWYILDTPTDGEDYDVPEWAKEMRVVSEISLDHHTALRFVNDK